MKKLLCLIILTASLFTACMSAHAENALNEAIEYLSAVGVDFEYEEETVQPDKRVTRAVFAQNVTKILNLSDRKCTGVYYHDVSEDHWAYNNIGVLTELGIVSGDGNKYFNPDEYITRQEAATILVSVLGYSTYAKSSGGYPDGYMNMASELEIFKNCSTNPDFILSDMLIMLKNALDTNVMITEIKGGGFEYTKAEDETLLSYYHDMYYEKGTLTGCDGVSLKSADSLAENIAVIDGNEYITETAGLLENIGTEVEFLYKVTDSKTDERKLVWIKSLDRNDILDIEKDKYCEFDAENYVFSYTTSGSSKIKKIDISRGIIVIYNGEIAKKNVDEILNKDRYKVRFIESKESAAFNIAIVWNYENMVVGKVDSDKEIILDKFDEGKTLNISGKRDRIVVGNGKSLDEITTGDILSYYESEDGSSIRIEISKVVKEETAQYINVHEEKVLTTDNGDYVFFDKNEDVSVSSGDKVKLYLDVNGYIAYLEKVKTEGFAAYLIKAIYDEDTEQMFFKTLDNDGKVVTREGANKVRVDGTVLEYADIRNKLYADGKPVSQVVVLKTNADNKVISVDTTERESSEELPGLRLIEQGYTGRYKHHGRLVPKILVGNETVIFSVPSTQSNDDRDYTVRSKSDLQNDQFYTVDIYRYSEDNVGYEEILVIKDKVWSLSGNNLYILVDKIVKSVNADGVPVEKLIGNRRGSDVEIFTDDEFSLIDTEAKSGDLIEVKLNGQGEIEDAEIRYSYGSENRPINNAYNAEPGLRVVYAHEKVGNVLRIGYNSGADFDEIFEVADNCIVVYDSSAKDKIKPGTMWDIETYDGVGDACSTVAIQTIDETPYSLVIYK